MKGDQNEYDDEMNSMQADEDNDMQFNE